MTRYGTLTALQPFGAQGLVYERQLCGMAIMRTTRLTCTQVGQHTAVKLKDWAIDLGRTHATQAALAQRNVIAARLQRLLAILEDKTPEAVQKSIKRSVRQLPVREALSRISQDTEDAISRPMRPAVRREPRA